MTACTLFHLYNSHISADGKTPLGIFVKEEKKVKILIKTNVEVKQKKPSLKVKAKDGKTYYVWSELSYNQQTIRAHPQVGKICGQE